MQFESKLCWFNEADKDLITDGWDVNNSYYSKVQ